MTKTQMVFLALINQREKGLKGNNYICLPPGAKNTCQCTKMLEISHSGGSERGNYHWSTEILTIAQLFRFHIQPNSGFGLLEQTWCLQHASADDSLHISWVFKEKEVGMAVRRGGEGEAEWGKLQGEKEWEQEEQSGECWEWGVRMPLTCSHRPAVCQTFPNIISALFEKSLPLFLLLLYFLELLQVALGHLYDFVCLLLGDHQGGGKGPRAAVQGGARGGSGQALPEIFTHSLAFQKFGSEGSHMFRLRGLSFGNISFEN